MLRQKWGSVVCPACRNLVGVNDERCFTCGRWNPGLWGFAPLLSRLGRDLGFTQFVMWSCIILYLLTLAFDVQGVSTGGFNFLAPIGRSLFVFGASGVIPVFRAGRWWTFLTAGWLHAGVLHILFNMMWIRQLAPAASEMYGPSRMVIIYTFAGVTGFASSTLSGAFIPFLGGAGFTVGASAPIFGLLELWFSTAAGPAAASWEIRPNPGPWLYSFLGSFSGGSTIGRTSAVSPEATRLQNFWIRCSQNAWTISWPRSRVWR